MIEPMKTPEPAPLLQARSHRRLEHGEITTSEDGGLQISVTWIKGTRVDGKFVPDPLGARQKYTAGFPPAAATALMGVLLKSIEDEHGRHEAALSQLTQAERLGLPPQNPAPGPV